MVRGEPPAPYEPTKILEGRMSSMGQKADFRGKTAYGGLCCKTPQLPCS